jgi:hypothetical protein
MVQRYISWLFAQRSRSDPIGDLAMDAFMDKSWDGGIISMRHRTKDTLAWDAYKQSVEEFHGQK